MDGTKGWTVQAGKRMHNLSTQLSFSCLHPTLYFVHTPPSLGELSGKFEQSLVVSDLDYFMHESFSLHAGIHAEVWKPVPLA